MLIKILSTRLGLLYATVLVVSKINGCKKFFDTERFCYQRVVVMLKNVIVEVLNYHSVSDLIIHNYISVLEYPLVFPQKYLLNY